MIEVTVNPIRLAATIIHAKSMVHSRELFGRAIPIARNAPTLRATVSEYRLDVLSGRAIRTWGDAIPLLQEVQAIIDNQIGAAA